MICTGHFATSEHNLKLDTTAVGFERKLSQYDLLFKTIITSLLYLQYKMLVIILLMS